MVNFGYGPGMKYWKEERKDELADRLTHLVRDTKVKLRTGTPDPRDPDVCIQILPYVEVDELYSGVRIRKITHLTEESQDELIKNAEKVYRQVMTGETV